MAQYNTKFFQNNGAYFLAGSGVIIGDTSATLTSCLDIYGTQVTMAYFGAKGWGTMEQGSPNERAFSFTGLTVNIDNTVTLTGIKTVDVKYPYTETAGFDLSHAGGTSLVFSNNPGLYATFGNINNDTTVASGSQWIFPGTTPNKRPQLAVDADATLDTELITHGELLRHPSTGNIISINTDATPAQTFTAGAGISITDNGTGDHLITNTGGVSGGQVKVDASDTTADYLDPKINIHSSDASVIVTKTITNPMGNEILDIDLTTTGGGSPSNPLDITLLDDFISSFTSQEGANDCYISGNFGYVAPANGTFDTGEINHPGFAHMQSGGQELYGFCRLSPGTSNSIGLEFGNDFDITFLARMGYSTGTGHMRTRFGLFGSSDAIEVQFDDHSGTQVISYDIGGGLVPTVVAFPVAYDWFKVKFTMVSGTLTAYLNSTVIYTGTPAFVNEFYLSATILTLSGGATLNFDIDYVLTNYKTTR